MSVESKAAIMESVIQLPIEENVLKEIIEKTKDWSLMHGAAMRSKLAFNSDTLQFAPFILIPSPYPREQFQKAIQIQVILNELIHKVAHDSSFLTECLKETIQVDEFTGNLFKIYEAVLAEGITQRVSLGLFRSDYMVHNSEGNRIKQVEFNTIASSFGGVSTKINLLNRYVLQELGYSHLISNLPDNNALEGLCIGMIEAWKLYGKPEAVILFIVEDVTYNICDQRFHEFEIRRLNPQVKIIRRTLTEMADKSQLQNNNELFVDKMEVAVIYFRAGYEPNHYHTKREWDARLLMERSLAIKSPSIQYHLAGTKKVQQMLARKGALERFYQTDTSKMELIRDIFTGLYSLDFDESGDQAVQMAINNPERYVLKPQREGGGNNLYGDEIKTGMIAMKNKKDRTGWILMDRINPPISKGYLVRPGGDNLPAIEDLISELGIFGVVIGDSEKILINRQVGHMLRTKKSSSNEGGVAAGLGALDSPCLID